MHVDYGWQKGDIDLMLSSESLSMPGWLQKKKTRLSPKPGGSKSDMSGTEAKPLGKANWSTEFGTLAI